MTIPARLEHPRVARSGLALAASLALAVLAGCADMSGIHAGDSKMRDAQSLGLSAQAAAPRVSDVDHNGIDATWWLGFGDAQLNALIEQALKGNPNLAAAQARVAKAQSSVLIARSADLPQVGAGLDLTRQRFSENFIYPAPLGGASVNTGTLQLSASWELDFFGKNKAAIETAVGGANAAVADADAARVLLTTRVASGYIQWARLESLQAVAKRTLEQRQETLKLVRDRVSAGLDTRLELRQSESGIPEARQRMESLAEQIALNKHALDALVGQPGATDKFTPPALASFKPMQLPAHIPADLLGQRPDVVAARWRVEAATKDVAYAKTLFYPNIDLVASAGYQSLGFDNLLKPGSRLWSLGPAVRLPIFEGGQLRANLRGKNADMDAAIESYNTTVLDAVRDVSDQVSSIQSVARQQVQQREGQEAAEGAYDIAVQRYSAGLGTYLNVLTAENNVLLQRRDAVDLASRALDTQVGLAHALGGGYQASADTAALSGKERTTP
ncbi:efflux transporter outer membrane subunit [Variovorax sp. OV329]|uniref:efflux transporter outer membrane subunit n=1 Tax=Variovorax sp. OV329 TaxID=1882825 RepID=UPI0008E3266B|nr:efflux transporter outer membrane subunit [Variovorax sp. OV329]SFM52560.1 efflux transporter, outer membrane factor (OMF) lipoprotein, NodT family [Variovorax sp. OV329]